jgi:hypothetical protein
MLLAMAMAMATGTGKTCVALIYRPGGQPQGTG